jgi:hypothetical protein
MPKIGKTDNPIIRDGVAKSPSATSRPAALPVNPGNIPAKLKAIPQWVVWRYEWSDEKDKWDKPPMCVRTGKRASSTDPKTWCNFDTALAAYRKGGWDGIGIVLTAGLGIVGIDLDKCRDRRTKAIEPWAREIIDKAGSYTEISPSGTGIRIIAQAAKPEGRCRKGKVEMYATGRYLTITGQHLDGSPRSVVARPKTIKRLHAELFPPPEPAAAPGPAPSNEGHLDDDALIEKAKAAKNGDKFARLWAGDASGYPSHSEAVLALCGLLAFWTGGNHERIDRLFRRSGLFANWAHKWERLGKDTIAKALEGRTEFHTPKTSPKEKDTQAAALVKLALGEGVELFHDHNRDPFASIPTNGHTETHRLRSKPIRLWLGKLFYSTNKKPPGAQAVQDALAILEGKAVYDGETHPVHVRVAGNEGKVYIDLCNDAWQVVEVDADGWRIIDDPPVKFRRAKAMLPLPTPEQGGSIDLLRRSVNVADEDLPLVLGCLVAALRPSGPYPVLALKGEQGSAKSTTSRVYRALVDPNTAPVRAEPKEPRDLAIAANNAWMIALDNVSYLTPWLSDALCRVSTGGGFATRTLYENDEETIFDGQRPVIVNGIEEVATRPDLLDRCLLITCPTIPEERRLTERTFWRRFDRERPRSLGALLDAVSAGLRNLPKTRLGALPRMADFAKWVCACAPALGFTADIFLDAYASNRETANQTALESSPIVQYILDVAAFGKWNGTAAELLVKIGGSAPPSVTEHKSWPRTPRGLSGMLRRLVPNLRQAGIEVDLPDNPTGGRGRIITIKRKLGNDRSNRSNRSNRSLPQRDQGNSATVENGDGSNRSSNRSGENREKDAAGYGRYRRYDVSPSSSNGVKKTLADKLNEALRSTGATR